MLICSFLNFSLNAAFAFSAVISIFFVEESDGAPQSGQEKLKGAEGRLIRQHQREQQGEGREWGKRWMATSRLIFFFSLPSLSASVGSRMAKPLCRGHIERLEQTVGSCFYSSCQKSRRMQDRETLALEVHLFFWYFRLFTFFSFFISILKHYSPG